MQLFDINRPLNLKEQRRLSEFLSKTGSTLDGKGTYLVPSKRRFKSLKFLKQFIGIDFVCLEDLSINTHALPMLIEVADATFRYRSNKIKDDLAKAKARGVKLGNPKLINVTPDWKKSILVRRRRAKQAYEPIFDIIKSLRLSGHTLEEIRDRLNNQGHVTTYGKPHTVTSIHRIMKRYAL